VFCQNWDISQQRDGQAMTAAELAGPMLHLQREGCHNEVDLPTHA
jgi:putative pyruvate formate lyase activating enzyme